MKENDERKGMPSASKAGAYEKCPLTHKASKSFKNESSPEANLGTLKHLAVAGGHVELQDADLEDCRAAEQQRETVLDFVFPERESNPPKITLEKRMWYRRNRFSGVPDLLAIRDGHGLIIDYKFGRIKVANASDNAQLKWLAVLARYNHKITSCTACIIQPTCGGFTTHTYDLAALKRAQRSVTHHLRQIEADSPVARPGKEQCRYCLAREACPALAAQASALTKLDKVEALTPMQMSQALEMADTVETVVKAIRSRAGEMLKQDGDCIPGFYLKPGSTRRSLGSTVDAYRAMRAAGLVDDAEHFMDACSVSITKLNRLADKADVAEALRNQITFKEGEPKPCRAE